MANINRQITLAARPQGFPKESDFRLVSAPIGTPGEGECLVQVIYLSVDPVYERPVEGRQILCSASRDRSSHGGPCVSAGCWSRATKAIGKEMSSSGIWVGKSMGLPKDRLL